MVQEDNLNQQNRLYSSRSLPTQTKDFLGRLDEHSLTSTLYQPPSPNIRSAFERASKLVILNQGNLKSAEDGESTSNVAGSLGYGQHIKDIGVSLSTFSSPDKLQRLHIKSYQGTINGEEVGLLSTGNLSPSSLLEVPQHKSQRILDNLISKIPFLHKGSDLYQLNTAIELHNKKDITDLKSIQQSIAKKGDATTTGNFLVGPDSNLSLVNDIKNASISSKILVASPYLDDPNIINALTSFSRKGGDVTLITSNPDSKVDRATGGSIPARKKLLYTLSQSGATVYMPDVDDPLLTHYKGAVVGSNYYLGSNNFTNAAFRKESLDITYRGENNLQVANQLRANFLADIKDFEFIKKESTTKNLFAAGITNETLSPFFNNNTNVNYILPSQYGTSHFYEKSIYNAMRENAGAQVFKLEDNEGYAVAAYRMKYIATHGEGPKDIPWYVQNYDREMATPGLSYYINEYAIRHGFGRIYKDEVGPLPSLAGLVGSFLDKSLTYYSSLDTPDYIKRQQEINPNAVYTEPQVGFFENILSFATNFIIRDVTSILSYVAIGVPFGVVTTELFRTSAQGLLDHSLEEKIEHNFIKRNIRKITKGTAAAMAVGFQHTSKSPSELREFLFSEAQREAKEAGIDIKEAKEIKQLFKPSINSLLSITNLIENQRSGIYFDKALRPFIENIVNPYNPKSFNGSISTQWAGLQIALNNFRATVTAPAFQRIEGTGKDAKFIIENIGYDKHKKIAESLDKLGSYLPINPMRWGLLGHNYTDPKLEIIKGEVVGAEFVRVNEVFSFTGLLRSLEKIYYGGQYLQMVNATTIVDETTDIGRVTAKIKSSLGVPTTIMGRAKKLLGNVYKEAFLALQGKHTSLGDIQQEYKKLRSLESNMLGKALKWNESQQMREIDFSKLSDQEIDKYLHQLGSYNKKIDPHRMEMLHKAVDFAKEQEFAVTKIRNPHTRLSSNWFLKNRGNIFLVGLSMFAAQDIFVDLTNGTTGASITSQVINAIMHRDLGATPEFTPTRLFGGGGGWSSYALSIGYTAFAIGTGLGIAGLTDGVNRDIYHLSEESIAKVKEFASRNAVGPHAIQKLEDEVLTNLGHAGRRGTLRPSKQYFTTALAVATGLLVTRDLSRHFAAGLLNTIRGLPFVGEFLFGKGDVKLNEKFINVSRLEGYRKEVIRRMQSGQNISSWSAMAAYQVGIESGMVSVVDNGFNNPKNPMSKINPDSKDVRVITNESRLPYIRFFTTEINKGRMYGENGELVNKGIMQFRFGIESAPILGLDTSFALPININLNAKNRLGWSLVYNHDGDNVLNYLQSVSAIGGNALVFATTFIATLEGMQGIVNMIPFFNKDNHMVQDLKEVTNFTKTVFKTFYNGLDLLIATPFQGLNYVSARFADAFKFTTSVLEGFIGKAPKASHAVRRASFGSRIGAALLFAFIGYEVASTLSSIVTQDSDIINSYGWYGLWIGGTWGAFNPELSTLHRSIKSLVSPIIKPITNKITNSINRSILSKVPGLPKNLISWALPVLFAGAAWFMTDSKFGLSKGMDVNYGYNGEENPDYIKRLTTIGLYSGIMSISIVTFSEIGKSPTQLLDSYIESKTKSAIQSSHTNPLEYLRSQYHSFNVWKKGRILNDYLDAQAKYLHEANLQNVSAKELSEALVSNETPANLTSKGKLKQAIDNITGAGTNELDKLIQGNSGQGIKRIFETEEFLKFSKGTGKYKKLGYAATAFALVPIVASAMIYTLGHFFGGRMGQQAVNDFYDKADGWEGFSNVIRLITWRDKKPKSDFISPEITLDDNGLPNKKLGYRLMNPIDPDQQQMANTLKNIMAPFVVDPLKQFQSVLPNIGINIKQGEYGVRYRAYAQEHSGLQDTSFSVYSTMPAYMFKLALAGNRQWDFLIEDGMRIALNGEQITSNSSEAKMNAAASVIMSTTAQLNPLSKPRKFSNPISDLTKVMVVGDSLLSMSLKLRLRRTSELSYQPIDSISNRMVDLSDFNMMNTIGSHIDIHNPLASVNLQLKTKNIDINLLHRFSTKNFKDLIREIFAAGDNGRIALTRDDIKVDRTTKEVSVTASTVDDNTEWLDQSGTLYLDTINNTNDTSMFGGVNKLFKGADDWITGIPVLGTPIAKLAMTMASIFGMSTLFLGAVGSFIYNTQQTRFAEATELTKNLFGAEGKLEEKFRAFHVNNRVMGPGVSMKGKNSFVINGRGNIFTLSVPEGVDLSIQTLNQGIQSLMINNYNATDEMRKDIFEEIGVNFNWDKKLRSDVVSDLKNTLNPIVDSYINKIFTSFTDVLPGTSVGFGQLVSPSTFNDPIELDKLKQQMKDELFTSLETSIEEEIGHGKLGLGILTEEDLLKRFKGYEGRQAAIQLAHSLFQKFIPLINQLNKNLIFLEPEDALGYSARLSREIDSFVKEAGGYLQGGKNFFKRGLTSPRTKIATITRPDGTISVELNRELSHLPTTAGRTRFRARISSIGHGAFQLFNVITTATEAANFFGDFIRTSAYQSDPNRTEGEAMFAAEGASANIINSVALGTAAHIIFKEIPKRVFPSLFKGALQSLPKMKGRAALIAAIGILTIGGVYAAHNYIEEQWGKLSQSHFGQSVGGLVSAVELAGGVIYDNSVHAMANGLITIDKMANRMLHIPKGMTTAIIGGAVAGATLAFGFGLPLLTLAGFVAGGAAIGFGTSFIAKAIEPLTTGLLDWVYEIPGLVGQMLVTPSNYAQSLRMNQFSEEGSPIVAMTAQQAIATDVSRYLLEAADTSGNRTKSLFINPTMYGQGYRGDEPLSSLFANPNKPLVDSLLDKEFSRRAQYYNQIVVGNTLWAKMIYAADNYNDLKKFTQIQRMTNPSLAIAHNQVKAQVECEVKKLQCNINKKNKGVQVTENEIPVVEAIYKVHQREINKPNEKPQTAITVHKSQITNKNLQEKMNQTIMTNAASPVLSLSIKASKMDGGIIINKKISKNNDMHIAATNSRINLYNTIPGYSN